MKISSGSLESMLKIVPKDVDIRIIVESSQASVSFMFTDKGGNDVKVTIYDSEMSMFPTITRTERLPR